VLVLCQACGLKLKKKVLEILSEGAPVLRWFMGRKAEMSENDKQFELTMILDVGR
jgi:hypothetical protein